MICLHCALKLILVSRVRSHDGIDRASLGVRQDTLSVLQALVEFHLADIADAEHRMNVRKNLAADLAAVLDACDKPGDATACGPVH